MTLHTEEAIVEANEPARPSVTPEQAFAIAEEAFIWGYPLLMQYEMLTKQAIDRDSGGFRAPLNQCFHMGQLLDASFTQIVTPNNDTLYSMCWLDVREEPVVLSVPAITGRYYSFQLVDIYTHNFGYMGTRTTGTGAGSYVIAGPSYDGEPPQGTTAMIRSEGGFVLALGRIQVNGPADAEAVRAIQGQIKVETLSAHFGTRAPADPPDQDFPRWVPESIATPEFSTYVNYLLRTARPVHSELAMLERFGHIGVGPERDIDSPELPPAIRDAITAGIASARTKIEEQARNLAPARNGWQIPADAFGDRQRMEGHYLLRAAAAMAYLYGNSAEEAMYPVALVDSNGEALDGSHDYELHFGPDEIPPVDAFWSITMYRLPERLFVANDLNRYSISDRTDGVRRARDGSLTFRISARPPRGGNANWLPAPAGPFYLALRMYLPKPEAQNGTYTPPPVRRLP